MTLIVAACLLALAAAHALDVPLRWSLGPLRVTSRDPGRVLVVAVAFTVVALALNWRALWGRRVAIALVVACSAVALLIRPAPATFPAGDAALIAISTIHAWHGQQLLGAYSQFGWHHPGPLGFYWLAPFFEIGRETSDALNTGVMYGNLLALAIVMWIVAVRHARAAAGFAIALASLITLYLTRVPEVLKNGWNPHTPVLPLVALLFVAAATLAGDRGLWVLALVLTSFIVQTHVGFALVAGSLCAIVIAVTLWRDVRERHHEAWPWRRAIAMVFLIELLWIFPIGEQIVHTPGNMTLILEFFFGGRAGQAFDFAWRAWGATLVSAFHPAFRLSVGIRLELPSTAWSIAGVLSVAALIPAMWLAARRRQLFLARLALAALVASLVGFYSVIRVPGFLGDYHIFWLSALGVVNVAVVIGAVLSAVDRAVPAAAAPWIVRVSSCGVIAYAAYLGVAPLFATPVRGAPDPMTAGLSRIMGEMNERAPSLQSRKTIVRLGEGLWGEGAGIVLQLMRQRAPITVAPEMVWMFGEPLRSTGREEQLLIIARPGEHQALLARPGNVVAGESGTYYADLIDLTEHPEYRPLP